MIVADDRVARFVSDRLGFGLCAPFTAMGIERDGQIVAGVIYNHFEGADVHITAAGKGWTPAFMQAVGAYVFGTLECQRFTVITENEKVAKLACRLGGEVEGRMRNHFGYDRDGILIGVLASEYRYAILPSNQARLD